MRASTLEVKMTFSGKRGAAVLISLMTAAAMEGAAFAQDFTLTTAGRVMIDFSAFDTGENGGNRSGTELRRLRLGVNGSYGSNLKYKVELNTNSSGEINAEDVFLEFKPGGGALKIKAGHFKTPNSLDELTSSRFISTLERSAFTDAFAFDRRVGIMASTGAKNYSISGGVFATNLENIGDQEGYAVAARGTYAPLLSDEMTVHLGASVRYRNQQEDGAIRYRQRPYTHLPGRIISTGGFAGEDVFYGFEAGAIAGSLFAAAEYGLTNAKNSGIGENADLSGGYGEAGVFFGGRKTYKGGKFNRPVVDNPVTKGGFGALALVARFDTLDLTDGGAVDGGKLDTFVLGADWYPVKNARIGLNYFNSDADLGSSTSGLDSEFADLVRNPAVNSASVSGIVTRLQFDF
jgi:phosphate-selective porin OprO/OprP